MQQTKFPLPENVKKLAQSIKLPISENQLNAASLDSEGNLQLQVEIDPDDAVRSHFLFILRARTLATLVDYYGMQTAVPAEPNLYSVATDNAERERNADEYKEMRDTALKLLLYRAEQLADLARHAETMDENTLLTAIGSFRLGSDTSAMGPLELQISPTQNEAASTQSMIPEVAQSTATGSADGDSSVFGVTVMPLNTVNSDELFERIAGNVVNLLQIISSKLGEAEKIIEKHDGSMLPVLDVLAVGFKSKNPPPVALDAAATGQKMHTLLTRLKTLESSLSPAQAEGIKAIVFTAMDAEAAYQRMKLRWVEPEVDNSRQSKMHRQRGAANANKQRMQLANDRKAIIVTTYNKNFASTGKTTLARAMTANELSCDESTVRRALKTVREGTQS